MSDKYDIIYKCKSCREEHPDDDVFERCVECDVGVCESCMKIHNGKIYCWEHKPLWNTNEE